MASSTAKSLIQLKTMKVIRCDEVKEIVTNEGNEDDDDQVIIELVFSKLITIEVLVELLCNSPFHLGAVSQNQYSYDGNLNSQFL